MDNHIKANKSIRVLVTGIKYNIKCVECGNTWGVYLNPDGNLPYRWDYCMACASRNQEYTREYFDNLNDNSNLKETVKR